MVALTLMFVIAPTYAADTPARIERDIPYRLFAADHANTQRQTLDLYVSPVTARKPPLVVFVHGGFWGVEDRLGIGPKFARALTAQGAAVALVRYRLAPRARHPAAMDDLAAAVVFLKNSAARFGYDPARIYLLGHSSGAQMTSLLGLDARYLRAAGANPADIAGVIAVSGIYDLSSRGPLTGKEEQLLIEAFGAGTRARRAASPVAHARRGPPFLVLSATNDAPGFQIDARRFAQQLRTVGADAQEIVIPKADHLSIMNFSAADNPARDLTLAFLGLVPLAPEMEALTRARRVWQEPPFSTQPFWQRREGIRSYPVDARLRAQLARIYEYNAQELKSWPLKSYHAIDLRAYLDAARPESVGRGDYLIITNVRGERTYWKLADIAPYRPVIVVGLDDERNLFRLAVFYRHKLEYSWKPKQPQPPMMARPLGAFLHFLNEPPAALQPTTGAATALTLDSFRLHAIDPLTAIADVPSDVHAVLTRTNACLSCHSFRGAGARAHHVTAHDGAAHGGFALALEDYPPDVWRWFMFEPDAVAARVGVRPNPVTGPVARRLYDLVVAERERTK